MKDIWIYKDTVPKKNTTLPTYEAIMTEEQGENLDTLPSSSQNIPFVSDSVPDCHSDMPSQQFQQGKRKNDGQERLM